MVQVAVSEETAIQWKTTFPFSIISEKVKAKLDEPTPIQVDEPQVLEDPECIEAIKALHRDLVATVADKSAGNVTLVCKRFYMSALLDEMENDVSADGQRTYIKVHQTPEEVTNMLLSAMNKEQKGYNG